MSNDTNKEIGKRIFNERKAKKMTRAKLGELVGLHESTVKRYEDGHIKTMDVEKLDEFAKALNISSAYLMGWINDKAQYGQLPFIDFNDKSELPDNVAEKYTDLIDQYFNHLTKNLLTEPIYKFNHDTNKYVLNKNKKIYLDLYNLKEDLSNVFLNEIKKIYSNTSKPIDVDNLNCLKDKQKNISSNLINVYGSVCAGDGIDMFEDLLDTINNPYPINSEDLFALKVIGDSMNEIINDGVYAIIKKQCTVNNGEIAVVSIDNEVGMLKKYHSIDDIVVLKPQSTNKDYKPMMFVGEEINKLNILGKLIGFVSPMM